MSKSKKKESRQDHVDRDGSGEGAGQVGDHTTANWESGEGEGKGSKMVQVTN